MNGWEKSHVEITRAGILPHPNNHNVLSLLLIYPNNQSINKYLPSYSKLFRKLLIIATQEHHSCKILYRMRIPALQGKKSRKAVMEMTNNLLKEV